MLDSSLHGKLQCQLAHKTRKCFIHPFTGNYYVNSHVKTLYKTMLYSSLHGKLQCQLALKNNHQIHHHGTYRCKSYS